MKILVVGDIHGNFEDFSKKINEMNETFDYILCCGDFGYWPGNVKFVWLNNITKNGTKIYFCDGNHERHDLLKSLKDNEIFPNVFYMKRGSILNINNKNILFFGGADSIDKEYRTEYIDWFSEENISYKDMLNLPPENTKIDIIISHTCPKYFEIGNYRGKEIDSNREYLSQILNIFNPSEWYFGHWHKYFEGKYKNTTYYGLNCLSYNNWFKIIVDK